MKNDGGRGYTAEEKMDAEWRKKNNQRLQEASSNRSFTYKTDFPDTNTKCYRERNSRDDSFRGDRHSWKNRSRSPVNRHRGSRGNRNNRSRSRSNSKELKNVSDDRSHSSSRDWHRREERDGHQDCYQKNNEKSSSSLIKNGNTRSAVVCDEFGRTREAGYIPPSIPLRTHIARSRSNSRDEGRFNDRSDERRWRAEGDDRGDSRKWRHDLFDERERSPRYSIFALTVLFFTLIRFSCFNNATF